MLQTPKEFSATKQALAAHLVSASVQFTRVRGLGELDTDALDQMSNNLEDVAGELLMFGADCWPGQQAEVVSLETARASRMTTFSRRARQVAAILALGVVAKFAVFGFSPAEATDPQSTTMAALLDFNGDGKVDIMDAHALVSLMGGSNGTFTRRVLKNGELYEVVYSFNHKKRGVDQEVVSIKDLGPTPKS
jgi:hypothetical protein